MYIYIHIYIYINICVCVCVFAYTLNPRANLNPFLLFLQVLGSGVIHTGVLSNCDLAHRKVSFIIILNIILG